MGVDLSKTKCFQHIFKFSSKEQTSIFISNPKVVNFSMKKGFNRVIIFGPNFSRIRLLSSAFWGFREAVLRSEEKSWKI